MYGKGEIYADCSFSALKGLKTGNRSAATYNFTKTEG